jgi:hypothetical protein
MAAREKPCAVCTVCGKYGFVMSVINERCGNRHNGKRCKGVWGSALNVGDWVECESCNGTGSSKGTPCAGCQASGWRFARRRTGRYFGA